MHRPWRTRRGMGSVRQMTDEYGDITLTQSYTSRLRPRRGYGEILYSEGTTATDYAFTGESFDPQTGLAYLRARYYQPADGRFTSEDPLSGINQRSATNSHWVYANDNPIEFTDPSGLFSVRNIVNSFNLQSPSQLIDAFEKGTNIPGVKGRWAWLKLLMDAKYGDQTWYGVVTSLPPFLDEGEKSNFVNNNGKINIGNIDLQNYANNSLNVRMSWLFPYRNGKPTNYFLNGEQYIDADRSRDLPDFRVASLDIAPFIEALIGAVPIAICGKGFTGGPSAVIDRYGNIYAELFIGGQLSCLGYISMGEGYVARQFSDIRWAESEIPTEGEIRDTITGFCFNGGVQLVAGISGTICVNGATAATEFLSPGIGGSIYGSYGFETPLRRPDLAWDYVDRIPGISKDDIYYEIMKGWSDCGKE